MKFLRCIHSAGFIGAFVVLGVSQAVEADAREQPNIVLIVADDLGIFDLGCYGRTEHRTQAIDGMAAEGVRFTDAYAASPLCSSSRAGLMTGKHPARLHLTTYLPGRPNAPSQMLMNAVMHSELPPDEKTIATILRGSGYKTGLFGKWHLGHTNSRPDHLGFEVVFEPPTNGQPDEISGAKNEYLIARRAIEFIQTNRDAPFFCFIPHHSPHILLAASDEAKERFHSAFSPLYAASLQALDRSVGLVIDAIRHLDSDRETIVIFTSDNGGLHVPEGHPEPVTHNGPYRAGKGYLYEGGIRVPLIVWSNRESMGTARVEQAPISLMDLMPTLARLAGLDTANLVGPLDGVDQSEQWLAKRPFHAERELYWHFPHYSNQGGRPSAAMRRGKWKLFHSFEDDHFALYDLENDLGELQDLSASQTEVVAEMKSRLHAWLIRTGAQMCEANPVVDSALHKLLYIDPDPSMLKLLGTAADISDHWKLWRQRMNAAIQGNQPVLKSPIGTVMLKATAGKVHGKNIRYEPEPNKQVIGYWTEVDDWVEWEFDTPQSGTYQVEVQYGCGAGQGGSVVELRCGETVLSWQVRDTGHFQNMIYMAVGTIVLSEGPQRLEIRPKTKAGVAVMDVRSVVLRLVHDE